MATQVQIRRAVQATQEARTLVNGELDANTTDNRICLHNGSTAGGVRHVNMFDQQNNEFNYAATSGTNAIAASMQIAPTSYVSGQIFWLKISNTNTSSCTLNINSLGAKTIKKIFNGALSNLSAGDLISGQMIGVLYDGTQFQIISGSGSEFGKIPWTPIRESGTSWIFTTNDAYYIEYGDAVTVSFDITLTQIDVNDDFRITNLPFAASSGGGGVCAQPLYSLIRVPENTSIIAFYDSDISEGRNFTTLVDIVGCVTYMKGF